jgi:hypothetical protein
MADRTLRKYGGVVEPDELVTDPADVVPLRLLGYAPMLGAAVVVRRDNCDSLLSQPLLFRCSIGMIATAGQRLEAKRDSSVGPATAEQVRVVPDSYDQGMQMGSVIGRIEKTRHRDEFRSGTLPPIKRRTKY